VAEGTVHKHLESTFERLGVTNRTAAAAFVQLDRQNVGEL
jgi:DNA-binding NarL/FixJ family response regulator